MNTMSSAPSIVAIVGLTTAVAKSMHQLTISVRQAPDVVSALSGELTDLALDLLKVQKIECKSSLPQKSRERLALLLSRTYLKVDEAQRLASILSKASSLSLPNYPRLIWIEGEAKAHSLRKDLRLARSIIATILAASSRYNPIILKIKKSLPTKIIRAGTLRFGEEVDNLRMTIQHALSKKLQSHNHHITEVTRDRQRPEIMENIMRRTFEKYEETIERQESDSSGERESFTMISINGNASPLVEPPPPYSATA